MLDIYLNPFTDFGFKKLFGEEPHKDLLISFLNSFLPDKHQIAELHYSKNEYQGSTALDRKAIFDLHCKSATGERFVVELQKAKQNYFKDRSVYYSTFPIQEQAERGEWDYRLSAVYTVGILDFVFNEDAKMQDKEVIHTVQLKNQHGKVFYDKLTFIYLTLPNFNKTEAQLASLQDKWLYVFKHLHELDDIPAVLGESVFLKLFTVARLAKLSHEEQNAYQNSLKYYRDWKGVTDYAREFGKLEGRKEGLEEGLQEGRKVGLQEGIKEGVMIAARAMHRQNLSLDFIAATLDLTTEEVGKIISTD